MNLKAIATALSLIPQLMPLVDNVVVSVEAAIPDLPGATKLQAALAKVESLMAAASDEVNIFAEIKPTVVLMVNAAVAAFNAIGLFKKATPVTATGATV